MDLGFLVDSSDSVDWNKMRDYMRSLVGFFDVSDSNVHVGIITYGDRASVAFPLNAVGGPGYTKQAIQQLITSVRPQGGRSKAFNQAMQLVPGFFSPQQGGRSGIRQVRLHPIMLKLVINVA